MTEENKNENSQQKCFFCKSGIRRDEKLRTITENNYLQLGVAAVELENSKGSVTCLKCWLSRTLHNRTIKKCPIPSCTTSQRGLQSQRLCPLPLKNVDHQLRLKVLGRFKVSGEEKACRKCRSTITAFIKEAEGSKMPLPAVCRTSMNSNTIPSPATCTTPVTNTASIGRPRVNYTEASEVTKRRMRTSARMVLQNTVGQCNKISQGDGWELLQDVTANTRIKHCANKGEKYQQKISEVIDGLSQTYGREAHGATGKIRLLSTIAPHFKNKELKNAFQCTDYELTEARKHAQQHGPGATVKKVKQVRRFRIAPEDLAFVINFIHHPDNTCRSSHRMASCEGSKSSWISDLFAQNQQPVMWLKDGKSHLYKKYYDECTKLGTKPISETKFRDGINAGNFKEMAEMAGLCNICDEVGTQNWKKFTELIEMLSKEIAGLPTEDDIPAENEEFDEDSTTSRVTMVDLTDEDTEYRSLNPLPVDSPVLMIEVGVPVPDFSDFLKRTTILKGHLLSNFSSELKTNNTCAFHCMAWLLNDKANCCKTHTQVCNECAQRFTLFDDLQATIFASTLSMSRKYYYQEEVRKVQENLDVYIAHLVRGKYQRMKFMEEVNGLRPGKAVVVCDYMMKLLLHKFREPQRDWFGKKGVSVHGSMFFFKTEESEEIQVEIHDVFSNGDCTQNWYFTVSAFEATFNNFKSRHEDVKSLVIWSDNGPHYHNTSVILWLTRLHEICLIHIERYSFFEAQKGKTSLDSHFATFKFAIKGWMKRGNDLLTSEDIVDGTKEHLRGTHVYEIMIDRTKEPCSAKTLDKITSYADFTFKNDHTIDARELTNAGTTLHLKKNKIEKLWPSYISTHCLSTGVTSEFDQSSAENVEPKFKKQKKGDQTKQLKVRNVNTDPNASKVNNNKCPNCNKVFLRKKPLQKHLNSRKCLERKKASKTLEEIKASIPVVQALGLNSRINLLYCSLLKGSAMKTKLRKNIRFTAEQKNLMERCFDVGEKDKKNRYTAQTCEKLMGEQLGKEMTLTQRQIKSFWSAYKRRKGNQ